MAVQSNSNNNKLQISWHDSCWIPNLNAGNVMDYFSQKSNPFYDRTCNNEIIRMQRGDPAQLVNMTGVEYTLLLVQEPILYVIRKTHRYSPDKVVPLAYFYILGGVVYQCPDLHSLINSRLLSSLHLVHDAFEEVLSYAKYDTSKGYYWKFPGDDTGRYTLYIPHTQ
jgi:mediator of RNA polymerase II transcription subunit 6